MTERGTMFYDTIGSVCTESQVIFTLLLMKAARTIQGRTSAAISLCRNRREGLQQQLRS